jgi:hypothetical protein
MKNEHIVSTEIYYYYNSNIIQSDLQFRTVIKELDYEPNDEEPLNQVLGEV